MSKIVDITNINGCIDKEIISIFKKSLSNNSTWTGWTNPVPHKRPYKPILIISILLNVNKNDFINKPIQINSKIIETYYNLLISNIDVLNHLKKDISKEEWFDFYNKTIESKVLQNMWKNPIECLFSKKDSFFAINKKDNYISFNYPKKINQIELFNFLYNLALNSLINCIPEFKDINLNKILNFDQEEWEKFNKDCASDQNIEAKRESFFAKSVKNRDRKCIICGIEYIPILEACHIKPVWHIKKEINSNNKKIVSSQINDINNGITLCKNHHKLFDCGDFTINANKKVIIHKNLFELKSNLFNGEFHFENINDEIIKYFDYHNKYIFKKSKKQILTN